MFGGYRQKWLSTRQREAFLTGLQQSLQDERTVALAWEEDGQAVGYVWVTSSDVTEYDFTFAKVNAIAVLPAYQGKGIGTRIMDYVAQEARAPRARASWAPRQDLPMWRRNGCIPRQAFTCPASSTRNS